MTSLESFLSWKWPGWNAGILLARADYATSRELDPRSGLFSLSMTMYDSATGEHSFLSVAPPRVNVFRNIVEPEALDPREWLSTLPDILCALIGKLLQKDRDARYQSAENF